MSYQAILFDFDGVLVDSEPIHYACWMEVLAPFGIALDWPAYERECIGVSDRLMVERLAGPVGFDRIWREYPRKQELFRRRMEESLVFLPGTLTLVKQLVDYKLAVVSSSGRTEVEPVLIRAEIRQYFQALVCGREVENLKPAPDPYRRAAELLGVSNALVVEDSDAGEASGRAAGFDVLRVAGPADMLVRLPHALP